jgi:hypothetical protein
VRLERDAAPEASEPAAFPPPREWRVTSPFTARADRQLADQLASELATLEIARELEGAARGEIGLEPPRGRILWRTAERQGVLEVGGDVPASSSLVAVSSERSAPVVVARAIGAHLERAPGDWRDKQVVASGRDEIERIRLVPPGGDETVLSRQGTGFRVERPFADAADPDVVDPLLSDLTSLRAERFLDAPLPAAAAAGLAAGAGRIELAVRGRTEPLVIELGGEVEPAGARYLKVGGQALQGATRLGDALARAPAEWRSKRWASLESWKVERLRITDGTGELDLARDEGDWRRGEAKIGYTDVGDLLYALSSARATRLLVGAEAAVAPAGQPELTVVLADPDGAEETLTLHGAVPGSEGGVAARVSGRDVVLVLAPADVEELRAKIAAARAAEPIVPAETESEPAPAAEPPAAEE